MAKPKIQKGMGIQNWLYLLLILILLPLLALQGYRYYNHYQEKQEEALQTNLEMARAVAKSFESFVQDVLHQELAIGLAINSSQKMTPADINRFLATSPNFPAVRDFTWVNPQGIAIYSNNPAMIGTNYSDRSYVRDVINGRDWAVGELVIGKVFGKPIFGISQGIRDDKGNLLGVIFAAILPDKLDMQLAIERSEGGAVSIVDRQGMLVYRYPAIEIIWEERNWLRLYPEYEEVFKGKEISKTMFATYEGKERLVGIVPISSIGWAAGAGKRKEDVTGPIVSSLVSDAVLFLSVSLIAFLIAAVLSRQVTNPIGALRAYASSLGDGKAPKRVDVEKLPELQDLAESLNAMAEKVHERETALRESEEIYRGVVQNTTAIILRVDPQGIIRFANERALQFFGYSAEELIGKHAVGTIIPERESTGRDLAAMVDGIAENPDRYHSNANENIRKNGERVWMEWTNSGIYDTDGKLKEFLSVGIDATESKRAEEALRVSEEKYRFMFENLNAAALMIEPVLDRNGRLVDLHYLMANPSVKKHLGKSQDELVGKLYSEVFSYPGRDPVFDRYEKVISSGEPFRDEVLLPALNKYYEISAYRPIPGRLALILSDITDRKEAEEALREANEFLEQRVRDRTLELQNLAEQLEKSRDDLRILASELVLAEERERKRIAAVLHDDIAQTLAVARMRVDLLQRMANDDESRQTVEDAKKFLVQSIRETRALMNDLGNPALFELGVAAACESLAIRLMENHPIQISCDIRDSFNNLEPEVKVILYQVVREMLNNVVKHSKAQHAEVLVHWEDDRIRAMVRDDGLGFEPQSIGAPTAEGGFGLFSIRERLMSFRGDLQIESAPGAGTIVTATVPARLKRDPSIVSTAS